MSSARATIILIVAGFVSLSAGSRSQATQDDGRLRQLLDRYAAGDFAGSVADAVGPGGAVAAAGLLSQLRNEAPKWISAQSDPAKAGLRAASFSLEAAGRLLDVQARVNEHDDAALAASLATVVAADNLVEWGCALMRPRSPAASDAERVWWLASVELLQHHGGGDSLLFGWGRLYSGAPHMPHAQAAIPNSPELALASAMAPVDGGERPADAMFYVIDGREEFSAADMREMALNEGRRRALVDRPIADPESYRLHQRATYAQGLQTAAKRLRLIEGDPRVSAHARVLLGAVALCFTGGRDAARQYFTAAPAAADADADVRFLAAFLTGRAFERDQRMADAAAAYRRALSIVPRSSSATMALAVAEWMTGGQAHAAHLIEDARQTELVTDPWEGFQTHAFDRWPVLLDQLHGALRR